MDLLPLNNNHAWSILPDRCGHEQVETTITTLMCILYHRICMPAIHQELPRHTTWLSEILHDAPIERSRLYQLDPLQINRYDFEVIENCVDKELYIPVDMNTILAMFQNIENHFCNHIDCMNKKMILLKCKSLLI